MIIVTDDDNRIEVNLEDIQKYPLMLKGIMDLVTVKKPIPDDWRVRKDRTGLNMVFYKDVPVDEIIYCVGEISLALTGNIMSLQQEYYEDDISDVFNIAVKLVRDTGFAKEFYETYTQLNKN